MNAFKSVLAAFALLAFAGLAPAAELPEMAAAVDQATSGAAADAAHAAEAHHGLPRHAPVLFEIGFFQVNSSMVVIWIVAIGMIVLAQMATRKVTLVPGRLQNFVEMLVEGMYGFFEEIVGQHMIKKTFWFFCTIFVFILFSNWFGLIPGLGTIGWGHTDASGHFAVTEPLLRGANADLNMTSAMALMFFFLWTMWSIQEIGAGGMLGHIFAVKGHGSGFLGMFLVAVFVFVGAIEIISICVRPVALMFRLYGNIFAGENILETVMHMGGPLLGGIFVLPFYLLEILVGLVQALVFALLCAVFTSLMCEHHEEGKAHAH